jgi:hypothetical protein
MTSTSLATRFIYCLLLGVLWPLAIPSLKAAGPNTINSPIIEVTISELGGQAHVFAKTLIGFTPRYFLGLMSKSSEDCAWIDKCVSVTILSNTDTAEQLIQTHINAPWPFKDRDMVVTSNTQYEQTTNTLTIVITDASNDVAQHPNRIRMTNVYGKWQIKPHNELFELSYIGSARANGNIPQSLARRFLKNSTLQTFENLQALAHGK